MGLIRIHELELDCIVGIRADERTRTQRLRVDAKLTVDTTVAARTGKISATVDWNRAAQEMIALLQFRRYRLIEVAARELSAMLLGVHPNAQSVTLRLEKPGALEGRARAASVEVEHERQDFALADAPRSFPVELTQTCDAVLTLHRVAPGERAPAPGSGERRAISWVVQGQLTRGDGGVRDARAVEDCEGGGAWLNRGAEDVTLFRCAVRQDSRA